MTWPVVLPKSFTADTSAKAADVQADFDYLAGILQGNIGTENIAPLGVGTANLADLSVVEGKLAADAVTAAKIKNGEVGTAELADSGVTAAKVAAGVLDGSKLATGAALANLVLGGVGSTALTGTGAKTNGGTTLTGTGTKFKSELSVGDWINVGFEVRRVTAIASDTSLTVNQAWTATASGGAILRATNTSTPTMEGIRPACLLTKFAGAQGIPNDAWTPVTFDNEEVDTHGFHSGSSDTITFPIPGVYALGGGTVWSADDRGLRGLMFNQPGVLNAADTLTSPPGAKKVAQSIFTLADVATAGSTAQLLAYQDGGAGVTVNVGVVTGSPFVLGANYFAAVYLGRYS